MIVADGREVGRRLHCHLSLDTGPEVRFFGPHEAHFARPDAQQILSEEL